MKRKSRESRATPPNTPTAMDGEPDPILINRGSQERSDENWKQEESLLSPPSVFQSPTRSSHVQNLVRSRRQGSLVNLTLRSSAWHHRAGAEGRLLAGGEIGKGSAQESINGSQENSYFIIKCGTISFKITSKNK